MYNKCIVIGVILIIVSCFWALYKYAGLRRISGKGLETDKRESNSVISLSIKDNNDTNDYIWLAPRLTLASKENLPLFLKECSEIFTYDAPWEKAKKETNVFKFYINVIKIVQSNDPELLKRMVNILKNSGISIALEAGGFSGGNKKTGAEGAEYELAVIKTIEDVGGNVGYVLLDNFFTKTLNPKDHWKYTKHQAILELTEYIRTFKEYRPNIKLGLIECIWTYSAGSQYPAKNQNNNRGDLIMLMDELLTVLEKEGLKLDVFHAESSYSNTQESLKGWEKLKIMEDYFRTRKIEYGYIYTDNIGGRSEAELFFTNTMDSISKMREVNCWPDHIVLQSWFPQPQKIIPENEPYTFMYIANQFIDTITKKIDMLNNSQ